jgi:integrase/recombinase XerD
MKKESSQAKILVPKMSFEKAIRTIEDIKREENVSTFSIKGYRAHMRAFQRYLAEQEGIYTVNDVLPRHMRSFIAYERKRNLKQVSLNNHIRYIRASFNILIDENILPETFTNPAKVTKLGKEEASSYFPIPEPLVKRILAVPNQKTFLGMRNYLIMIMILDTGIRPSELLEGEARDWTDNYYTVRAEVAKTGEARILPLSRETVRQLYQYERIRRGWGGERLFPNTEGQRFNTDGFRRALRKMNKQAGFTPLESERVHPYAFRHTFAYNYLENGGNIFKLQELLGHTDIAMTKRYAKLVGNELLEAHKQIQPLKKYTKDTTRRRRRF